MLWIFIILILNVVDSIKKQHFQTEDYKTNKSTGLVHWNEWTDCIGTCGETGYVSRYRSTLSGGVFCRFNHEWKTCHILGCTITNYTKLIEGNELRTQEFNYMYSFKDAYYIILDKCISDYCDYHTVKSVLGNNTDRFWNALLCTKHNLGCPVKGGWSKWSSWSKCTAMCGSGIQYRLRYCNRPKPSRTSLNCSGNYIEFKNCFGKSCTINTNDTWCRWSNWSRCSVRQGNGIIIRKRLCRHFNSNNTYCISCLGAHTEIGQCYIPDIDGGWSKWQKWSPCSAKCDKGTRYRMRSCSRPEPEGIGQECIGEHIQTNICYVEPCKGPPIMVATFNKESHLKYAATGINVTLLHVIIGFYPFDISGIVLRRFYDDCDDCNSVQLYFIDFHLFLMIILNGCNVTLSSPSTINMGWNEVSFIITRNKISLQLNNDDLIFKYIKCIAPTSIIQLDQVMNIGEDFEGYIDKLYVNCIPYALTIGNKFSDMYLPYATFNTVFELSEEQLYSDLSKIIKIPCPKLNNLWRLELYLRFEVLSYGNLIFIKSTTADYLLVEINNDIIKLKIKLDEYFDEVSIKFEEIDSSWIHIEIEQQENRWDIEVNGEKRALIMSTDIPNELCKKYLYIGNFQESQNSTGLQGVIGYLKLNDNILNPNNFIINQENEYNIFSHNLSDILYNEVTMTSEEDVIELNCIKNEFEFEDSDIAWLKSNEPVLHKINCNISNNCIIITNKHVSQITIFPKALLDDYFYICMSMKKQEIICVYGVTKFNVAYTSNTLKTFILFGKFIITITILFLMIIIKKIK